MRDIQQVTQYYHAAYLIAALIYGLYIVSLAARGRRAIQRLGAVKREP